MTARKRPATTDVIEQFITSRRAAGCAPTYETWLRYTLGFLARTFDTMPTTPAQIDHVHATLPTHLSDQTRRDIWKATRILYNWAAARHSLPNATDHATRPRRPRKKELHTLTNDEIDRIVWSNRRHPRDLAIVQLILDTGLRLGEVSGLTWDDIINDAPNRYTLRVNGKTGERKVPVSADTIAAIRPLRTGQRAVWIGPYGPIEISGVQCAVKRALARANIKGGPHMLRHTFADLYIKNKGDVFSLQAIMGHENIETTYRYVHLNRQDVQEQHAKFSPMAGRTQAQQLHLLPDEAAS